MLKSQARLKGIVLRPTPDIADQSAIPSRKPLELKVFTPARDPNPASRTDPGPVTEHRGPASESTQPAVDQVPAKFLVHPWSLVDKLRWLDLAAEIERNGATRDESEELAYREMLADGVTIPDPIRVSACREIVATWPISRRQAWGDLANRLSAEGWEWPTDEQEAFRLLTTGTQPVGTHANP